MSILDKSNLWFQGSIDASKNWNRSIVVKHISNQLCAWLSPQKVKNFILMSMRTSQSTDNLIDDKSRPFDVVVISRYQMSDPKLGVSKAYDLMIQSMNSQGLHVCLVTEGEMSSSIVLSHLLTVKRVPTSKNKLKSLMKVGVPHPISFWLSEVTDFLYLGAVVVAPIVGMQTAVFRTPKSGFQKYISTLHTPYSKRSPWGFVYQLIQRNSLSYSDIQIANSKTIIEKLSLQNSETVVLIPHSNPIANKFKVNEATHKLDPVWIGALTRRKGVDRLVILVFLSRKKSKLKIIWSTSKFDLFWRLILNRFASVGWCELIHNLTEDELRIMLANSSCLVSTTRFESFGLTLVEAARAQTGVVGMRAPGVTETLPETSGGAVYFENLRGLLRYLHFEANLEQFENLGKNAASYVEETYDFDKISMIWRQVLSK